jgi:hypothetical protein
MSLSTLDEIRTNVEFTTKETQVSARITEYINLTINEISDFHTWSFLRRKFTITATAEDVKLPRDVDKIGLVRQTDSPVKLRHVPDHLFYKWIPNPTAPGNPRFYRLWEEIGVSTQISSAEKVDIVSDSTSDTQKITIVGTDANDLALVETYTLNGTTTVAGTETFKTVTQVSKSAATVGNITVDGNTSATVFVTLLPEERSPRFKVMSFYPIPTSISILLEYYTRLRELVNDQDVPGIDRKWHYLIREGALAKVYQYKNQENAQIAALRNFQNGLRRMQKEDMRNVDFVPYLKSINKFRETGIFELADDTYVPYF